MNINKTLFLFSAIALSLLFCPAALIVGGGFAAVSAIFILIVIKFGMIDAPKRVELKELTLSFLAVFLLLPVFIIRWSDILNPAIVSVVGLLLCLLSSFAVPCFVKPDYMKVSISSKKLGVTDHLTLLIIAAVVITLVSTASPLVAINTNCDSNAIFTVGRSMLHGKLVYRDIIERKGVILFLIEAIGALISPYDFHGVWIVEILSCYLFLVVTVKTQLLFVEDKKDISTFFTGVFAFVLYGCSSFANGNIGEEYSIPLIACVIYLCIKAVGTNKVDIRQTFCAGICTAAVFWMKFNLCGAVLGIALFLLVYYSIRKDGRSLVVSIAGMLIGFAAVMVPILCYYHVNGALNDLVENYFTANIFRDNSGEQIQSSVGYLDTLGRPFFVLINYLAINYHMLVLFVIGAVYLFSKNRTILIMLIMGFIPSFFFAFMGERSFPYYPFILTAFTVIGILPLNLAFVRFIKQYSNAKRTVAFAISLIMAIVISVPYMKSTFFYGIPKEDYPSYVFSKRIEETSDHSLVCYGFLDMGFYTYSHQDPRMTYFSTLYNIDDYILEAQRGYIESGEYQYVVTSVCYEIEGYELIEATRDPFYGGLFYLYRKV